MQVGTNLPLYSIRAEAIWFKKTRGVVAVHIGSVWDSFVQENPPTLDQFIAEYSTARYGGDVLALWDGSRFWSNHVRDRDEQDALIKRLDVFLSAYPALPSGWLGWYKMHD